MMKVLILGAGASCAAGYPVASGLMKAIEVDAAKLEGEQLSRVWNQWLALKNSAPPELKMLLEHQNPEIIFSLLDLCLACSAHGSNPRSKSNHRVEGGLAVPSGEIPAPPKSSAANGWIDKAGTASLRLVESMEEYFAYRQYADIESPASRQYLHNLFGALSKGDVVITLNWDATADRSLFELNRWSPRDGYGFEKRLACEFSQDPQTLPDRITRPSEIKLLKLHGSVGWRSCEDDHLAFNGDFLQTLLSEDIDEVIRDAEEEKYPHLCRPLIVHPPYLKTVQNKSLREIWRQADVAIRDADFVEIYGYSLPPSDVAMSMLLAPLRWRGAVDKNKERIKV